jgi:hypothetical protein
MNAYRLFAVACARRVEHLITDAATIEAINVAERYAYGQATREELNRVQHTAHTFTGKQVASPADLDAAFYASDSAAYHAARALSYTERDAREYYAAEREAQKEIYKTFFNQGAG